MFKAEKEPQQISAVSKPSAELFSRSKVLLKSFVQYKDKLLLLAAYHVAKNLLSDPSIKKGDFTLLLEPLEGGKTKFIHGSLKISDTIGLRLVWGQHNGKEIAVASFRRKAKSPEAQKSLEASGGSPHIQPINHPMRFKDAIELLESAYKSNKGLSPEARSAITELLNAARSEQDGRESLLYKMCGSDRAKFSKMQAIFKDISASVSALISSERERRESLSKEEGGLTVSSVVGSAAAWPLSREELAILLKPNGQQNREFIAEWSREYALGVFPRVLGVELLEQTTKEAFDELQSFLGLAYSKSEKQEHFFSTMESFDKAMLATMSLVDSADAQMKKMKSWVHSDAEIWLSGVCDLAEKRQKILEQLLRLEKIAQEFHHEMPYRKHMFISLANIAVNLCSIKTEEIDIWNRFMENPSIVQSLKSGKAAKALGKKITAFVHRATKEDEDITRLVEGVKAVRAKYRHSRISNESAILKKIDQLRAVSPLAAERLEEVYASTKSHVSYKQRELISPNIEDAYFTRIVSLMMLRGQLDAGKYESSMRDCLLQNSRLFRMFGEVPAIKDEIMQEISSLLYVDQKGFDLEVDAKSLLSSGFRNQSIRVKYWLTEEIGEKGSQASFLNLHFLNRQLKVELKSPLPYDEKFAPVFSETIIPGSIEEELYGKKYELSEILGSGQSDVGLGRLYEEIFSKATANREKYNEIAQRMKNKDMTTSHFLHTLASEELFSGTITNVLGRNLPLALSEESENTMLSAIRQEYPASASESSEMHEYLRQKLAIRILRHLHASLPYYMVRLAQHIVSIDKG
ncbi:MAG: hypothetical protein QW568_04995, partial [Candidatus Anstonellaceae archaeon]